MSTDDDDLAHMCVRLVQPLRALGIVPVRLDSIRYAHPVHVQLAAVGS